MLAAVESVVVMRLAREAEFVVTAELILSDLSAADELFVTTVVDSEVILA